MEAASRKLVAAVTDLFFVAKLRALARAAGVEVAFVGTLAELVEKVKRGADLVVVDLNDPGLEPLKALRELAAGPGPPVPTLAFYSHVQTQLGEEARAAGCGRVVARSRLMAELVDWLEGRVF